MPEKDYYESLGVSRSAPPAEIRAAYLALAKKVHPDMKSSADTSVQKYHMKFVEINRAYSVLRYPDRRREYDRQLASGLSEQEMRHSKAVMAQYKRGMRLFNESHLTEAIAAFEKCLQLEPSHEKSLIHLGLAFFKNDDLERAEKIFKVACTDLSHNPVSFYYLGLVYKKMGHREKAQEAFTEAIYIDPDFQLAADELEQIIPEKTGSFFESLKPNRIIAKVFRQH